VPRRSKASIAKAVHGVKIAEFFNGTSKLFYGRKSTFAAQMSSFAFMLFFANIFVKIMAIVGCM
jgi:hypothetical protein